MSTPKSQVSQTHNCTMHHHEKGLNCSCCNPIWQYLIPSDNDTPSEHFLNSHPLKAKPRIFRVDPNLQIRDGSILTLKDGIEDYVEAIGIGCENEDSGAKIKAVGSYEEVKKVMGTLFSSTSIEEQWVRDGNILMPGLIEPHLHIIPSAIFNLMIDLGPFNGQVLKQKYTQKVVVDSLEPKGFPFLDKNQKTENWWVMGKDLDPSLFTDENKAFNAKILEKAKCGNDYPIFIMNASMHLAYLNQTAINKLDKKVLGFNISADGILKESDQILPVIVAIMEKMPPTQKKYFASNFHKSIEHFFKTASSRGVTYMLDAAVLPAVPSSDTTGSETAGHPSLTNQPEYLKSIATEHCPVRISGALLAESLKDFRDKIEPYYCATGSGNENFNLPFIKVVSDGSNQGLTGYQFTPYQCDENYVEFAQLKEKKLNEQTNTGIFNYGYPLEFSRLVTEAIVNDWSLMIHANGTHAIERTIAAFEYAKEHASKYENTRNRIEHASLLSDKNLSDMQNLNLSPSFLIGHVGYWGEVFQNTILGQTRAEHLDRCHSAIHKHGMRISLHSDYSVSPIGPLRMMEQAIGRVMEADPNREILNVSERISRLEALKSVTIDAAWHCHAEQWVGSLEVGKCADLVLLAKNPLDEKASRVTGMRNICVLETWKGGVKRYSDKDSKAENSLEKDKNKETTLPA